MERRKKVALPRYAEYNCAFKYFLEQGLETDCVLPPPLTQRTLDIGAKNSPDFVCTPFKTSLGSMIEALEAGADTLVMINGACKLGYYGELQEQILRDMGYEFEFINLTDYDTGKKRDLLKAARRINPHIKCPRLATALLDAVKMVEHVDVVTAYYYQNCGFALDRSVYHRAYRIFLRDMYSARNHGDIERDFQKAMAQLEELPLNKPRRPLRVGIIGEFYTAMDPFSNLEAEQKLANFGVEVHRWMNITNRTLHYAGENNLHVKIRELCAYEMGPTSTANIWAAKRYAEEGFDGIVHIKSANCTPEIDVMPVLQRIGEQYKIPFLYLTYDSQTSDVGLMTRLEAFYDMMAMRKKAVS